MRYLVSGKEMKLLDQNTSQVFHVPELVLMEQASMAFVQKLLVLKQNKLSTALIACGSGNNGGDGLAIARLLREQGVFVSVWPAGEEEGHRTSSSYDVQKQICSAYSIPVVQKEKVSAGEASYDVVIDALFGTGLSREISGELAINYPDGKLPWILLPESVPMMEQCLARLFVQTTQLHFHLEKRDSICGRAMNIAERYMWFPWELHRRAGWIISRIRLFWNRKT